MAMLGDAVNYSVRDHVARIEMNRPERHNALNYDVVGGLDQAFDRAQADPDVRAVVLSGAGKSFCSGWDRGDSPYLTAPEGGWTTQVAVERLDHIEERYLRIWNFPKPTIAQVHGHAIAAGCYLQLLCDISVAAEDATLGHPVSHGGVSSMPLWQVLLGPRVARYLLFTARTVSGNEAERLGLVTMAVPRDQLEATVAGIAADLVGMAPAAFRMAKSSLNVDLEMMGVGAMFRYHGQLNALMRPRAGGEGSTLPDPRQ
jgi:enoyl-CoA hydratase